jgi:ubiquinone/menaquinone biosynthesis C-methylase UbiE
MLSREEARAFYDRFGAKQDSQAFYEDRAVADLVAHAELGSAQAVCEFGCGTGRFAEKLLAQHLPPTARYVGCDVSTTMVELAHQRLARFGDRAEVRLSDGAPRVDAADGSFDRFVSNYVLDLLSVDDIEAIVAEAYRVLAPDGRLCLVSLTNGRTVVSKIVTSIWTRVHHLRPSLVGGCRPIDLQQFLRDGSWQPEHQNVVVAFGIPSEVVVVRKARAAG